MYNMILTKQILLEEVEQDIDSISRNILRIKWNYKEPKDLQKVLDLYKEIKHLEYMKEYLNSVECATDIQNEKELSLNECNYV